MLRKKYQHTNYVLIEAASDCLLGFDFLKRTIVTRYFQKAKSKKHTRTSLQAKQITEINNHVNIAIKRITNPEIFKLVSTAEESHTCLVNAEQHDQIRTIGNKTQTQTKILGTCRATFRNAILHNNKTI